MASNHPELLAEVTSNPVMTPEFSEKLTSAINTFKTTVPY